MMPYRLALLILLSGVPVAFAGEGVANAGGADVQVGDAGPRPRMWVGKGDDAFHSSYAFQDNTGAWDWPRWYVVKSLAEQNTTWQAWRATLNQSERDWLDGLPDDTYRHAIWHAMSVWPGGGS